MEPDEKHRGMQPQGLASAGSARATAVSGQGGQSSSSPPRPSQLSEPPLPEEEPHLRKKRRPQRQQELSETAKRLIKELTAVGKQREGVNGYKMMGMLGKGKFSTVFKARRREELYALKKVQIFDMMSIRSREKCLKEIKLLQSMQHPNIIRYIDSFIKNNELLIVLQWAQGGDLKNLIRRVRKANKAFSERQIFRYCENIVAGLRYMHESRIMHRDLKPANIMLTKDNRALIGDFGLSRYFSNQTIEAFSKVGTPLYMSPEVLQGGGYTFSADMWSLGCILYELCLLKSPFKPEKGSSLMMLFNQIKKGTYTAIPTGGRHSNKLIALITNLMRMDPHARPDTAEVHRLVTRALQEHSVKEGGGAASRAAEIPAQDNRLASTRTGSRGKRRPGGGSGLSKSVSILVEVGEMLKVLDYETHFCAALRLPKLSRVHFAGLSEAPGAEPRRSARSSSASFSPSISPPQPDSDGKVGFASLGRLRYFFAMVLWLSDIVDTPGAEDGEEDSKERSQEQRALDVEVIQGRLEKSGEWSREEVCSQSLERLRSVGIRASGGAEALCARHGLRLCELLRQLSAMALEAGRPRHNSRSVPLYHLADTCGEIQDEAGDIKDSLLRFDDDEDVAAAQGSSLDGTPVAGELVSTPSLGSKEGVALWMKEWERLVGAGRLRRPARRHEGWRYRAEFLEKSHSRIESGHEGARRLEAHMQLVRGNLASVAKAEKRLEDQWPALASDCEQLSRERDRLSERHLAQSRELQDQASTMEELNDKLEQAGRSIAAERERIQSDGRLKELRKTTAGLKTELSKMELRLGVLVHMVLGHQHLSTAPSPKHKDDSFALLLDA